MNHVLINAINKISTGNDTIITRKNDYKGRS